MTWLTLNSKWLPSKPAEITLIGGGGVYTPHDSPITKIKFVNSPITKNSEPFHQLPRIITDHNLPPINFS